MKERPILFSSPMVRAILAGTKTQTRRLFKGEVMFHPQVPGLRIAVTRSDSFWVDSQIEHTAHVSKACPYGAPGDRLWVRETWAPIERRSDAVDGIRFRADDSFIPIANTREAADRWVEAAKNDHSGRWRPSIFMRRWASRITLDVTAVRLERLQSITEEDSLAEGVGFGPCGSKRSGRCADNTCRRSPSEEYALLWDSINGKRAPWASNPWVWVVSFKTAGEEGA